MSDIKCNQCKDTVSVTEDVKDFEGRVTRVSSFCPSCSPPESFAPVYPKEYWDLVAANPRLAKEMINAFNDAFTNSEEAT